MESTSKITLGRSSCLVRSGTKAGIIKIRAELIEDGINCLILHKVNFTIKSTKESLYNDLPYKTVDNLKEFNNESLKEEDLRIELLKTRKY